MKLLSTTIIDKGGESSKFCLRRLGMVDATIYRRLHLQDIEEKVRMELLNAPDDNLRQSVYLSHGVKKDQLRKSRKGSSKILARSKMARNVILGIDDFSKPNNKYLSKSLEDVAEELNEIMRSKVAAMRGNCIQGYKIELINLIEENQFQGQSILIAMQAIGDALELDNGEGGVMDKSDSEYKNS